MVCPPRPRRGAALPGLSFCAGSCGRLHEGSCMLRRCAGLRELEVCILFIAVRATRQEGDPACHTSIELLLLLLLS